jgi:hypothetical protein
VKKLFALVAVVSLAAIGCEDKKSTNSKPTGGTYEKTNKVETHATVKVTDTVKEHTVANTHTATEHNTVKVPDKTTKPEGPTPPKGDKPKGDGK